MAKTKIVKETETLFQEEKKEEKVENSPPPPQQEVPTPINTLNITELPTPELTLEKIEEALNRIIEEKLKTPLPVKKDKTCISEEDTQKWLGIYDSFQRDFPTKAIQQSKKESNGQGRDITGIGIQFCINRINETVSPMGWDFTWEVLKEIEGKTQKGKPFYDITTKVTVTILGVSKSWIGGNKGYTNYADTLKGAIGNGIKKTLSLYGVGRQAYEGTLDEDLREYEEKQVEEKQVSKAQNDAISKLCKTIPVSKEKFLEICNYDLEMKVSPPVDGKSSIVNSLTFDQKHKVIEHLNKMLNEMKKGEQEKITKLPERKEAVVEEKK